MTIDTRLSVFYTACRFVILSPIQSVCKCEICERGSVLPDSESLDHVTRDVDGAIWRLRGSGRSPASNRFFIRGSTGAGGAARHVTAPRAATVHLLTYRTVRRDNTRAHGQEAAPQCRSVITDAEPRGYANLLCLSRCVCVSVCPSSKRQTVRAINIKVGTDVVLNTR